MLLGVAAGLVAGALWGLTFIAPVVTAPDPALVLTAVRYAVFGLLSAALLGIGHRALLASLRLSDWLLLAWLGFAGNVGYFLLMALAVERVGAGLVALIVGCLPVVLALLGNTGPRRLPLRTLALPLALLLVGLLLVNLAGSEPGRGTAVTPLDRAVGVGMAVAAMALWAAYAIGNDRALARRPEMTVGAWTSLTGLGTLLALLPLLPIGLLAGPDAMSASGFDAAVALRLLVWGLVLGGLSSFAATWAWSLATRRLPVALTGQLIVSETLFALLYEAMLRQQLPSLLTLIGAALLLAGVVLTVRRFAAARAPV